MLVCITRMLVQRGGSAEQGVGGISRGILATSGGGGEFVQGRVTLSRWNLDMMAPLMLYASIIMQGFRKGL